MPTSAAKHSHGRKPADAKRTDDRLPSSQRGYDSDWRRLKRRVRCNTALCEWCWKFEQRAVAKAADDHIIPFAGVDDDLRLDASNIRGLCRSCHTCKTQLDEQIRATFDRLLGQLGYEEARDRTIEQWRWRRPAGGR